MTAIALADFTSQEHRSPERRRWGVFVVVLLAIVGTGINTSQLPILIEMTGLPGAAFNMVFFPPLLIYAARYRSVLALPPIKAYVFLSGMLTFSAVFAQHFNESAGRILALGISIATALIVHSDRRVYSLMVWTGGVYCMLFLPLWHFELAPAPRFFHFFAAFVFFGFRYLQETSSSTRSRYARIAISALLMLPILKNGIRSSIIGIMLGVFATLPRTRNQKTFLVAAVGLLFAVFINLPSEKPSMAGIDAVDLDRGDLLLRLSKIREDKLSSRLEVWSDIAEDLRRLPPWLTHGVGIGDVDYYVASIARDSSHLVEPLPNGEEILHTHNLGLEVLLAAGVPALPLLVWFLVSLLRRFELGRESGALCTYVLIVGASNVPIYDTAGGAMVVGALLGMLAGAPVMTDRRGDIPVVRSGSGSPPGDTPDLLDHGRTA